MSGNADNVLTVAGQAVQLQPLTLGQWKRLAAGMQAMAEGTFATRAEVLDHVVDVVLASAARSAPQISRADVEETLDWHQAGAVYARVLALSMPATSGEMTGASLPGASTGTLPSPASA